MEAPPLPTNEIARQAAVDELNLSAIQTEDSLDRVTRLLARITDSPIAAFTVLDRDRQFFPSVVGLDLHETQRSLAFCSHTIDQDDILVVEDATLDERFSNHPLVVDQPYLRFYAGVPIRARDGLKIGALCVLDTRPRRLDVAMREAIDDLRVLIEDKLRISRELAIDPHTGTASRRSFDDLCGREWRRAMRSLSPISTIVAELDEWRAFSTSEGSAALDRGLRATALAMQYSVHRPGDCVCRYDATRFALLLPVTDERGAAETAERVRVAVGSLQIPFGGSPHGVLTLSLGIDTVHSEDLGRIGAEDLIQSATTSLRHGQRGGGNRWEMAARARERWRRVQGS